MVNSSSGWFPMPVAIPRSRSKSESRFHRLSGSPEKSFGTPALRVPITVEFTASSLLAESSTHLPLLQQHPYGEKEKASCIIYRCLPASYPLLKDAYALMQRLKLDRTNFSSPLFINLAKGRVSSRIDCNDLHFCASLVERQAFKNIPRCIQVEDLCEISNSRGNVSRNCELLHFG